MTLPERFWGKVDKTDDCWPWTASTVPNGYGQYVFEKRHYLAHRFAYERLVGPIAPGLQLDHLCRNRLCVNPDHLEPVTQRENLRRGHGWGGRNARRTHCINGHEFNEENTRIRMRNGWECRTCLTCEDIRNKNRNKRKVETVG